MTEGVESEQVCLLCKGPVGSSGLDGGFQLCCCGSQDSPETFSNNYGPADFEPNAICGYESGADWNAKDPCSSCKSGHWLHYECLEIIRATLEECECSTIPCPDCQRSFKLPHGNIHQGKEGADVNNNVQLDPLDKNAALENCKVLLQEFQSLQSEVKSCETAVMSACDLWQQSPQSACSPVDSKNLHGIQSSYESIVEDFLGIQEAIKSYAETNQLL